MMFQSLAVPALFVQRYAVPTFYIKLTKITNALYAPLNAELRQNTTGQVETAFARCADMSVPIT